jgi:hypothetical protein
MLSNITHGRKQIHPRKHADSHKYRRLEQTMDQNNGRTPPPPPLPPLLLLIIVIIRHCLCTNLL